eukprot:g5179.t1
MALSSRIRPWSRMQCPSSALVRRCVPCGRQVTPSRRWEMRPWTRHWLGDHFHFTDPTDRGAVSTPDAPGAVAPNEAPHVKAALDTEATPSADAGAGPCLEIEEFSTYGGILCAELSSLSTSGSHLERCPASLGFDASRGKAPRRLRPFRARERAVSARDAAPADSGQRTVRCTEKGGRFGEAAGVAPRPTPRLRTVARLAVLPQETVSWQQKECYGANWAEGKDHDECMKEGIHSFPTVRFYSQSGDSVVDFTDERTPDKLIGFAAQQAAQPHAAGARGARIAPLEETRRHPGEDAAAALAEATPLKVVEYVAKSCPHCKSMEPIWNELKAATQQKDIIWEQKECFGEGWTPGKDLEECKRSDIQGFPTLKLFSSPTAAGEEFQGARSASSILKWVEQHAPQPTGVVADRALQAVQACVGPQLWMASSLCGPVLPPQSKASFL